MDLLASAIAAKKRPRDGDGTPSGKRRKVYKTKKQIQEEEEAAVREQQMQAQPETEESGKTKKVVRGPSINDLGCTDVEQSVESTVDVNLPREEVVRRLRSYREVVTYFGETDQQRLARLIAYEANTERQDFDQGSKNEFQLQMKEIEEMHETNMNEEKQDTEKRLIEANRERLAALRSINPSSKAERVLVTLKRLLYEWEEELLHRTEEEKRTSSGKLAYATMKQTATYLRPLILQLKKKEEVKGVPSAILMDMLEHLHRICIYVQEREYVKAHDQYLQLAIGNSPWPIGVTSVGIHERSAQEKLYSNQIAHVLNDETQRKYIQSVKRLMSFAQRKYPADPSKTVG